MKSGAFVWALLWFAASAYAGYRLTERSFVWIHEPNFGVVGNEAPPNGSKLNLDALKGSVPPEVLKRVEKISPQQLVCVQAVIGSSRIQAALKGQLTAEEIAAVQTCLK